MQKIMTLITSALIFAGAALADTLYVSTNGTAVVPYSSWETAATTIQDAVDAAVAGDTVLVGDGVYDSGETVTPGYASLNRVVITNNITVQSANGPGSTLIVGAPASGGGTGVEMRCAGFLFQPGN